MLKEDHADNVNLDLPVLWAALGLPAPSICRQQSLWEKALTLSHTMLAQIKIMTYFYVLQEIPKFFYNLQMDNHTHCCDLGQQVTNKSK